jgi:hypothetical protein
MNTHQLDLGAKASGKSFKQDLLYDLGIPGTICNVTDMTAKALYTNDAEIDCALVQMEETPPSLIGASDAHAKGKSSGNSADMEKASVIKSATTSGVISFWYCDIQNERKTVRVTTPCSAAFVMAANFTSSQIEDALSSRFMLTIWSLPSTDTEEASLLAMNARRNTPAVKAAFEAMQLYFRRTQMLCYEINLRVHTEVLSKINDTVLVRFFNLLARYMMKKRKINLFDIRKFHRLRNTALVQVVVDAIDLVYDSPLSPFKEQTHSEQHFLAFDKHLYMRLEHVVYSIGENSIDFQNKFRNDVVQCIRARWFPNAKKKYDDITLPIDEEQARLCRLAQSNNSQEFIDQVASDEYKTGMANLAPGVYLPEDNGHNRKNDKMQYNSEVRQLLYDRSVYDGMLEQNRYWMYDSCSSIIPKLRRGGKDPSKQEVLEYMTSQLVSDLPNRPMPAQVYAVLSDLTYETSDESREVEKADGTTDTLTVSGNSAMMLDGLNVRMSLRVLAVSVEGDELFNAVQHICSVLQPPGKETTYLYGEPDANRPGKLRTFTCKRPDRIDPDVLRMYNADFANPGTEYVISSFLSRSRPVSANEDAHALFRSEEPWTQIDCDLDLVAEEEHAVSLGLSQDEQGAMPDMRSEYTNKLYH